MVALLFSQTLLASHDNYHPADEQADCWICLQASSAGAAVSASESIVAAIPATTPQLMASLELAPTTPHFCSYLSRAPPAA